MTYHKFQALPPNGACYRACMDVTLTLHALSSRRLYQCSFQKAQNNDICSGKQDVQHVVHTEGLHLCNASLDSEMMTTAFLRPVASQLTPHACEGSKSFKSTTTRNVLGLPTQSGQGRPSAAQCIDAWPGHYEATAIRMPTLPSQIASVVLQSYSSSS